MTDRERWTVYPLLFLALGVSLKDKLTQSITTNEVRCKAMICNELLVANAAGTDRLQAVGGNLQANSLIVGEKKDQRVALSDGTVRAPKLFCGALVVANAEGKETAAISTNEFGGFVRVTGIPSGTVTLLGNTDQVAGLFFIDPRGAVHAGPIFASPISTKRPAESKSTPPVKASPMTESETQDDNEPAEAAPAAKPK